MGYLTYIKGLLRKVIRVVKGVRKITHEIKELTIEQQVEVKRLEFEAFQKEYNELQKRTPRAKWEKFDTMVNDLIDEYDYDRVSAVEELKYMLKTDEIDLDEEYIDFLREHDTP